MIPYLFYLMALIVMGASTLLLKNTTARTRVGGREYEKRRTRKLVGRVLMMTSVVPLLLGILHQVYSNGGAPEDIEAGSTASPIPPTSHTSSARAPLASSTPLSDELLPHSKSTTNAPPFVQTTLVTEAAAAAKSAGAIEPASKTDVDSLQMTGSATFLLEQAKKFYEQDNSDKALLEVSAVIKADPNNSAAYSLRGTINAQKKDWNSAAADFTMVLKIDGEDPQIRFDLAEVLFAAKKYEDARASFVLLLKEPRMTDLASYKIYLCDLLGGRPDSAAHELDAFNRAGSKPSYYFSNAADCIYHQKIDDAKNWLKSASYIYPPEQYRLYFEPLAYVGSLQQ